MKTTILICTMIIVSFSSVLAQDSYNLFKKGVEQFDSGQFNAALYSFTKAIIIDEKNKKRDYLKYYYRGLTYINIDSLNLGMDDLNISIEINSEFYHSYQARSECFYYIAEHEKAENDINKAINLNNFDLDLYSVKSLILFSLNKYDDVIKTCGIAHKIKNDSRFYGYEIIAYCYLQKYETALKLINSSKKIFGNDENILEAELFFLFLKGDIMFCDAVYTFEKKYPNNLIFITDHDFVEAIKKCSRQKNQMYKQN